MYLEFCPTSPKVISRYEIHILIFPLKAEEKSLKAPYVEKPELAWKMRSGMAGVPQCETHKAHSSTLPRQPWLCSCQQQSSQQAATGCSSQHVDLAPCSAQSYLQAELIQSEESPSSSSLRLIPSSLDAEWAQRFPTDITDQILPRTAVLSQPVRHSMALWFFPQNAYFKPSQTHPVQSNF